MTMGLTAASVGDDARAAAAFRIVAERTCPKPGWTWPPRS